MRILGFFAGILILGLLVNYVGCIPLENCTYRTIVEVENTSPLFSRTDPEFYIEIDTKSMIDEDYAKDCWDIFPVYKDELLDHWYSTNCNEVDTQMWIRINGHSIAALAKLEIYLYHGCGDPNSRLYETFEGNFVNMELDGCVGDSFFVDMDGMYPVGAGSLPLESNSSESHSHEASGEVIEDIDSVLGHGCEETDEDLNVNFVRSIHTHEFNVSTIESEDFLPPYFRVPFCSSQTIHLRNNSLVMFDNTNLLSDDYEPLPSYLDGFFVRGHESYISDAEGSETHTHTLNTQDNIFETTSSDFFKICRNISSTDPSNEEIATIRHSHTIQSYTLSSVSNIPSYRSVNFGIRISGDTKNLEEETDIRIFATGLPPFGFEIDDSFTNYHIRYDKNNPGDNNDTSIDNHQHEISEFVTSISNESEPIYYDLGTQYSTSNNFSLSDHEHVISPSDSTTSKSGTIQLPVRQLLVLKMNKIDIGYKILGVENLEEDEDRTLDYIIGGISFGVGLCLLMTIICYCCCLPLSFDIVRKIYLVVKKHKNKKKGGEGEGEGDNEEEFELELEDLNREVLDKGDEEEEEIDNVMLEMGDTAKKEVVEEEGKEVGDGDNVTQTEELVKIAEEVLNDDEDEEEDVIQEEESSGEEEGEVLV